MVELVMLVRATESHIEDLIQLRNLFSFNPVHQYDNKIMELLESRDFLNGNYTFQEFHDDLEKTFIIWEEQGSAKGYIRIDNEPDKDFEQLDVRGEIEWLDRDFKEEYFKLPHAEIGAILVAEELKGKGIGHLLLESSIQVLISSGYTYLFSFVVDQPISNIPSIKFHLKEGFIPVARLKKQKVFFGYKNYQSTLYVKSLQFK